MDRGLPLRHDGAMRFRCLLFLFLWLAPSGSAGEADWPRFRGPDGSGVSGAVRIPAVWEEADYAWKAELPGVGHGSPVIAGHKVFLLCADETTSDRIPVCLDAGSGAILWQKRFPTGTFKGHKHNSAASTTPAVDGNRVYFSWGTEERLSVAAFTLDGAELWQADLGPIGGGHGFAASPVVSGDVVVLNGDQEGKSSGFLFGLDKKTGEIAWRIPRRGTRLSYSTPCETGGKLVFTNWEHGITLVDPPSGKVLAELGTFVQHTSQRAISSPIIHGDLVIATCGYTGNPKHCVGVRVTGDRLEEVWRVERNVPHIPSPLVVDGWLYLWDDQGIVSRVDPRTGEVGWRERVGGNYFGSPVSDGRVILCIDADGQAVTLEAGPEFRVLGRTRLGELCRSTPALGQGRVYVRIFDRLWAIRAE